MELLEIKKNNETTKDEVIETFDASVVEEDGLTTLYSTKLIKAFKDFDPEGFNLATCSDCITGTVCQAIITLSPNNDQSVKFTTPCNLEVVLTSYKESRWTRPYYLFTLPEEEVL